MVVAVAGSGGNSCSGSGSSSGGGSSCSGDGSSGGGGSSCDHSNLLLLLSVPVLVR